jgi:hypothetical protein
MGMRILKSLSVAAALTAAGLVAGVFEASAQSIEARVNAAVAKIQAACSADLQKYCSMVTPGEGRILLCIQAHEDKISSKCDFALFEASRNLNRALDKIERAAAVCWGDIEKNCAGIPEGGGGIARCLVTKKASLSKACQTELGKFPAAK